MPLGRLASLAAQAFACAALLWAPAAQGRQILELDARSQPAVLKDWGDYWVDREGNWSLGRVLARSREFRPTPVDGRYDVSAGEVLWIRIAVPAAPDDQRWYLRIAQPGLDLVTLFTRNADGSWSQQQAGDLLPVSAWALPQPYPVLALGVSAAEPTQYMLRVQASDGLRAPVEFVTEGWQGAEQQRFALRYGVCFGLLAMGAIFAIATAGLQRDLAFLWFGLWTASAMLASAVACGIAGLHLWPESPHWSDAAHQVVPGLSAVPFLLFVSRSLALHERAEKLFWPCVAAILLVGAIVVGAVWAPGTTRRWIAQAAVMGTAAFAMGLAAWAWRRGEHFAPQLLLGLAPFAAAMSAYLARARLPWLTEEAAQAGLLAGLIVSVGALYLLLSHHTQARRDSHRRVAQIGEVDPTTGLVNDTVFTTRARELVERSQRFGHQSALAVIEFPNLPQLTSEFGHKYSVELLVRLVERLQAMTRTVDTVARLGRYRFGLLVDGPIAPSRARAMCAKVIAHCIMPMAGLPLGMVVKPRIAMALVPQHGTRVADVVARLDALLEEAASDPTRVILLPDMAEGAPAPSQTAARWGLGDTEFQQTNSPDEVD